MKGGRYYRRRNLFFYPPRFCVAQSIDPRYSLVSQGCAGRLGVEKRLGSSLLWPLSGAAAQSERLIFSGCNAYFRIQDLHEGGQ